MSSKSKSPESQQPSLFDVGGVKPDVPDRRGANGKLRSNHGPARTTAQERREMRANRGSTTSQRGAPEDRRGRLDD